MSCCELYVEEIGRTKTVDELNKTESEIWWDWETALSSRHVLNRKEIKKC